jgi:hypothetical protein
MIMFRRSQRRERGQTLMEFALVLPVFMAMLMGITDVGRAIWATTSLNAAAREGARYAIVHGGTLSDPCPVGPPGPDSRFLGGVGLMEPDVSCIYPSPSKQYIYDTVLAAAMAGGSNVTVTACYGAGCTGDIDTANNRRGTPITVTVTSQMNLVTPSFVGITSFTLSGTSTMVVNH